MSGTTSRILQSVDRQSRQLVQRLQKLQEIGIQLSAEQDLEKLLDLILRESRFLTDADAGTIFVREDEVVADPAATGKDRIHTVTPWLAMKVAQNDSIRLPFRQMRLSFDPKTISGYVAVSGDVVNLPDVYHIPDGAPYAYSRAFDGKSGYRCKSMLVLPMKNRAGEIIGVIQLINKKKDPRARLDDPAKVESAVTVFDPFDEEFLLALASQAAICVEKAKLYEDIERMFEGLVNSFSLALEKRNKTTSGHCMRVARYAVALAEAINDSPPGAFGGARFTPVQLRELKYAALLHDIGKIGVPEAVLDKHNKLLDSEMLAIEYRFRYAADHGKPAERMKEYTELIRKANIPRGMADEETRKLEEIRADRFVDADGAEKPLLTDREYENLSVRKGNLTDLERRQIEQHALDTWEILKRIPWPRDFRSVPNIAGCHHEKIDGTGYPWKLRKNEIPLCGQILALVDIYEALTARDRPYKPALPVEKALSIVQQEVDRGGLNAEIWKLFLDRRIYALFATETGYVARPPRPDPPGAP
jgi:HD-GYP domain-containing protein (c-di-GMP phosphodiesterase class II)